MPDIALSLVQYPDFSSIDVKSHNVESLVQKRLDQGQPYIAQSDDGDLRFFILYFIFQFPRFVAHRLFLSPVPAHGFSQAIPEGNRRLVFQHLPGLGDISIGMLDIALTRLRIDRFDFFI